MVIKKKRNKERKKERCPYETPKSAKIRFFRIWPKCIIAYKCIIIESGPLQHLLRKNEKTLKFLFIYSQCPLHKQSEERFLTVYMKGTQLVN